MIKRQLTDRQKERVIAAIVVLLGVMVFLGQIVEAKPLLLRDLSNVLWLYIDPIQNMVGMLFINFILVMTAIKIYEKHPNSVLDSFKWYFTILLANDFIILVLRIIQKGSFIALQNGFAAGVGKTYMILASAKGLVDLTLTSVATIVLAYGLTRYAPLGRTPIKDGPRLGQVIIGLIVFQWLISIPINLTGFFNSRTLYSWSLSLNQITHVSIIALLYWVVKESHIKHRTQFLRYLNSYYLISFALAGLIFTYSMGYFGLLQRFPAGEIGLVSGFGQFVFYISRLTWIFLNYLIFLAIVQYSEEPEN